MIGTGLFSNYLVIISNCAGHPKEHAYQAKLHYHIQLRQHDTAVDYSIYRCGFAGFIILSYSITSLTVTHRYLDLHAERLSNKALLWTSYLFSEQLSQFWVLLIYISVRDFRICIHKMKYAIYPHTATIDIDVIVGVELQDTSISECYTNQPTTNERGVISILRWRLTSIRNPIVEKRQPYYRLISTVGFPSRLYDFFRLKYGPLRII